MNFDFGFFSCHVNVILNSFLRSGIRRNKERGRAKRLNRLLEGVHRLKFFDRIRGVHLLDYFVAHIFFDNIQSL
jgi:hypothetical protein